MRVLFLTYDLPYPLIAGGKIRAYYLIKNLSQNHQITLFSYYRDEEQKKYLGELKKYCQEVHLFKREKPWSWQNLLRTFLTPLPFAATTYYSPPLKKALIHRLQGDASRRSSRRKSGVAQPRMKNLPVSVLGEASIKELKEKQYDLVHFESFYPALYLPLVKKLGIKTLMGNENIEYQVYNRYANSRNFFLRWLLKPEVLRMRFFEEKLWQQADVNLALSEEDANIIKKASPKPCFVIPNGVDFKTFKEKKDREGKNLIFIGTLIYQANNDAMKFFLKEIYPKIKRSVTGVKFILVSWHQPKWLKKYLTDNSIEFVQDKETPASEFLSQGDIFIAPMRVASGTNIKVLEAMAAGLPVVTTSVGIEGIEATTKEVIVQDNPQKFADEVIKLLKDKARSQQLGKAGRELVEKRYDWEKIGEKLNRVYREQI